MPRQTRGQERRAFQVLQRLGFRSLDATSPTQPMPAGAGDIAPAAPQPVARASQCWWCLTPQPADVNGWTSNELPDATTIHWVTTHPLGGFSGNWVALDAGRYIACPACTRDAAHDDLTALIDRIGRHSDRPLLEGLHRRMEPAQPLTTKKGRR